MQEASGIPDVDYSIAYMDTLSIFLWICVLKFNTQKNKYVMWITLTSKSNICFILTSIFLFNKILLVKTSTQLRNATHSILPVHRWVLLTTLILLQKEAIFKTHWFQWALFSLDLWLCVFSGRGGKLYRQRVCICIKLTQWGFLCKNIKK